MRSMKMRSMAAGIVLASASSLASAAEDAASEPAAGEAADPSESASVPADTGAAEAAAPASKAASSTNLNIDLETASAYVWRGMNLFGENQNTQNFSLFPSVTLSFSGLSIGYFGAYQLSGDNSDALVDGGTGAQQTLILKYGGSLTDELSYSAGLVYWVYPFADREVANTDTPMSIEPGVGATYATVVDVGLYVGYFSPLQDVNEAGTYVYISPSVGKSVPIAADIDLALGLSAGYKAFTNLPSGVDPDKAFDLTFNAGATLPFSDMYVTPQLHAAFLTRSDAVNADFGDEFVAWAGVHVGYDIGL